MASPSIYTILAVEIILSKSVFASLPLCGNCVNEPATDYIDKKVTTGVLWTDPSVQTRMECASRSFLFPVIKSYGFSEKTQECVAYTVPLSMAPASVAETGFNMFSTCAPVDGGFTSWSTWGPPCSATCGPNLSVTKTRTRSCTNPQPDKGGANCTGDFSETADISCELPNCPIHGAWSTWGAWSGSCSITCGSAYYQQFRSRTCTNPRPQYGGNSCPSGTTQSRSMSCGTLQGCPVNGVWTDWTSWSGACGVTCGSATYQKTRSRSCTNPAPSNGGNNCAGDPQEVQSGVSCELPACVSGGLYDYNFGTCTTTADCPGTNRACEEGKCVCSIMYEFNNGNCIQGCSSYGSLFTSFKYKAVRMLNDLFLSSLTIEACKQACIDATGFECHTADWAINSGDCYLSSAKWWNIPIGDRADDSTYYLLVRNCA